MTLNKSLISQIVAKFRQINKYMERVGKGGGEQGGEMTQTMYAHVNKIIIIIIIMII
jgi:hypothetical protein